MINCVLTLQRENHFRRVWYKMTLIGSRIMQVRDDALPSAKSGPTCTRLPRRVSRSTRDMHAPHADSSPTPWADPMSTYALQTKTMLRNGSNSPLQLLGAAAERESPKAQLPSKRKRDQICGLGTSNKAFIIKPYPDSPYDNPATFKPVRVIGRAQLPLTFFDTSTDESFAVNPLFSAHIDVLEENGGAQEKANAVPQVLIARYDTKRTLYAIERVQARVYSICKLASWLKEKDVADLWDPSNAHALLSPVPRDTSGVVGTDWWQHAAIETPSTEPRTKRAQMTMLRKEPAVVVTEAQPTQHDQTRRVDSPATYDAEAASSIPVSIGEEPTPELPTPPEQLQLLVHQYLDAIYMSKTSLAYFAKGPVTRIRNAFTSPEQGAPQTNELVTFLRSMLLSPKASERKYYERLPSILKALPPGSFSDEDVTAAAPKLKKTKKKLKLSREGTYPHEEAIVKKWWILDMQSGDVRGEETVDQRIRRRTGELRVRETLAQLILMLEITALEALSTYKPPPEDATSVDDTQTQNDTQVPEESQTKPKKRKRKLDDISLQLDLLLDRLCIWHATEEAGILDFDTKPGQQNDDYDGNSKGSDRLCSFCIEVIIPFYMNRLPEQALMINKKLGGPAHNSPPKRKAMKPPTTSHKSGEPKEPDTKKPRRSLARVATENMGRTTKSATPSLVRSMTDSSLFQVIKREGSEVPMSAIPFQRSPSKNARRSMSQIRHLEGRELDLTTPSAAVTAKLKQKQRVEEDLQEAISALKKPNRGLAAGGYVNDLERRSLGPSSRSRKQPNPVRKVVKDVQVTATPRMGHRTRDMFEHTPQHPYHMSNPFSRLTTAEAPPSSDFCITSSGARPAYVVPGTVHRSATARTLTHPSIAETPSKAPTIRSFSSGAARRTIFATPSKPTSAGKGVPVSATHVFETLAKDRISPPSQPAVIATPTKTVHVSVEETAALSFSRPSRPEEPSIYAALGWDDDDL
jgi:DNA replication regulator SLD3